MSKYMVQAVHRDGFEAVSRAKRRWTSAEPIEIEVLEQDEDPTTIVKGKDGVERKTVDPARLGRGAFAEVVADPRLSVKPTGGVDAIAPQIKIAVLDAEIKAAAGEIRRLSLALERATEEGASFKAANEAFAVELAMARAEIAKLRSEERTVTGNTTSVLETAIQDELDAVPTAHDDIETDVHADEAHQSLRQPVAHKAKAGKHK